MSKIPVLALPMAVMIIIFVVLILANKPDDDDETPIIASPTVDLTGTPQPVTLQCSGTVSASQYTLDCVETTPTR